MLEAAMVGLMGYMLLLGPLVSAGLLIRHLYFTPVSSGLRLGHYYGLLGLAFLWTPLAAGLAIRTQQQVIAFIPMLLMAVLAAAYFRGTRNSTSRVGNIWELLILLSISWFTLGGIGLENGVILLP